MLSRFRFPMLVLLLVFCFGQTAQAVLLSVGPRDLPSPPGNGFPVWYQDTTGLTLDLCLPKNQAQLVAGACLILPPDPGPPPVPGFNLPLVFPTNFPDESFWYNATATMDLSPTDNAVLVLALEAAFSAGEVNPGDQVAFGRLRIIVDAPVAGNYTVTTPHGVFRFPNVAAGKRAITFTSDIGIGAPGDFTGALGSLIGPFLLAAASEGGTPPLPLVTIPGDTSGDLFLSDPALPVFVTGSPGATNYFEICTDSGVFPINNQSCVKVNQFTLVGRIFNGTPFVVEMSYYARDASGAGTVNVFGLTSSNSGTASYSVSGTNLTTEAMTLQGTTRDLFASIPFTAGTTLPATITVTATDPPRAPTVLSSNLVDLVIITQASYHEGTQSLIIHASSSDQFAPPTLTATGLGALVNGVLVVPNILAPPVSVTVTSSKGGTDTAVVTVGVPGAAQNDFDGDGKTDVAVYRAGTGVWWVIPSSGAPAFGYGWGGPAFTPIPGDYDGDRKTDIAVYESATGFWWIVPSSGAPAYGVGWGGSAFKSVVGDFDGDGKTDIAVYETATGIWWIVPSSGGLNVPYGVGWGAAGDILTPADYDGDGKTDVAVYRPSTGGWFVIPSSNPAAPYGVTWGGLLGDIPVPGDYDGDGKADVAFYRPGLGSAVNWYILPSATGVPEGFKLGNGDTTDIPVTGDYDGDGLIDMAIYNSITGLWTIIPSSTGIPYVVGWGADLSDIPLKLNWN